MYSERDEEQIILDFFSHHSHGNLLDIGAANGVHGSNSLALLELGWQGVLVEPSQQQFDTMLENYTKKNLINQTTLVNCAMVPDYFNNSATFYDTVYGNKIGHGLGSFNREWVQQWVSHLNSKSNNIDNQYQISEHTVDTIRCKDFFNIYGYGFDFISIDVELMNLELAVDLPWDDLHNLKLICIESDENTQLSHSRFITLFEQVGFKLLNTDSSGLNLFFCRNK